jgi:hypothetical protein
MAINQDFTRINQEIVLSLLVFVKHFDIVFASRHIIELVSHQESNSSVVSPHNISREMVSWCPRVIFTRVAIPPYSIQPISVVDLSKADDLVKDILRLFCLIGSII